MCFSSIHGFPVLFPGAARLLSLPLRLPLSRQQYHRLTGVQRYLTTTYIPTASVPDPNPDPPDPRVLGLPDPDPLVRGMDPDQDAALDLDPSIIMQK
jgi:hypothetical protein